MIVLTDFMRSWLHFSVQLTKANGKIKSPQCVFVMIHIAGDCAECLQERNTVTVRPKPMSTSLDASLVVAYSNLNPSWPNVAQFFNVLPVSASAPTKYCPFQRPEATATQPSAS